MKFFVSYRRSDSSDVAGRISDYLAARFGVSSVFKDVSSIPLGTEFAEVIKAEVDQCDVFLAIIGPTWSSASDSSGRSRLSDPNDFVRLEIETALQRGIPVVPILVSGAAFPSMKELPAGLKELATRQGLQIRPDPDFRRDVDRLVQVLERLGTKAASKQESDQAPDVDLADFEAVRVFVSHSTFDRDWVEREIVASLEKKKIRTWYSKTAIKTAAQWEREIVRGLESCDWFLLVASPNSAQSEWVRDEVYWAIFKRPAKIITVIMDECNLWDFHMRIPRLQHIDFRHDLVGARKELLGVFGRA